MPRRAPQEEVPEELPPLDGDLEREDEEHENAGDAEDLDPLPTDDGNPFDDSTGEGDPVGDEWLERTDERNEPGALAADAEPDDALDVGEDVSTGLDESGHDADGWLEPGAADTLGAPDEDLDLVEGDPLGADAGEEGPMDADEGLREEDLPSLDADDGGEGDDAHFFDSLSEDAPVPWSTERWDPTPVVSHLDVGRIDAVAPAPLGAMCLGDKLLRVELDGAVVPLSAAGLPDAGDGEGRTIANVDGAIFVSTGNSVYRSADGGESFDPTDEALPHAPQGLHGEAARCLAAAQRVLSLSRGFELACATYAASLSPPAILALVRALAYGRLYVVQIRNAPIHDDHEASDANAAVVAEIAEPEPDADADSVGSDKLCAVWDAQRGLLWIGGPFGVLALQPSGHR
jgi:hypothetical protein